MNAGGYRIWFGLLSALCVAGGCGRPPIDPSARSPSRSVGFSSATEPPLVPPSAEAILPLYPVSSGWRTSPACMGGVLALGSLLAHCRCLLQADRDVVGGVVPEDSVFFYPDCEADVPGNVVPAQLAIELSLTSDHVSRGQPIHAKVIWRNVSQKPLSLALRSEQLALQILDEAAKPLPLVPRPLGICLMDLMMVMPKHVAVTLSPGGELVGEVEVAARHQGFPRRGDCDPRATSPLPRGAYRVGLASDLLDGWPRDARPAPVPLRVD